MVGLKFWNDFKMLESSKPWEWCQPLFRLKLKSLLPTEWLTFIIQNWYQSICRNMVYEVSISTHMQKLLISNIFTNKGKFAVLVPSNFCLPHDYIQGNNNVQFKLFESFATIYPSHPY